MTPWPEPTDDSRMKVQYLGHSCFLLTTSKAKILI
ncbi:MAG: Zn-dependent hydrolase, partial [Verrucomicrobia bacterium]|nr:Zn-dependent hydrolase [Verrucomicrobiota bacterium]